MDQTQVHLVLMWVGIIFNMLTSFVILIQDHLHQRHAFNFMLCSNAAVWEIMCLAFFHSDIYTNKASSLKDFGLWVGLIHSTTILSIVAEALASTLKNRGVIIFLVKDSFPIKLKLVIIIGNILTNLLLVMSVPPVAITYIFAFHGVLALALVCLMAMLSKRPIVDTKKILYFTILVSNYFIPIIALFSEKRQTAESFMTLDIEISMTYVVDGIIMLENPILFILSISEHEKYIGLDQNSFEDSMACIEEAHKKEESVYNFQLHYLGRFNDDKHWFGQDIT